MIGLMQFAIIGVLIIIVLAFLKFEHHGRKIKVILGIILIAILYLSLAGIFNSGQVDVTSPKGIVQAAYLYVGWLGETATSLWDIGKETVGMVGNAIKINNTQEEHTKDGRR